MRCLPAASSGSRQDQTFDGFVHMAALPLVKAGRLMCEYYPVKAFRA